MQPFRVPSEQAAVVVPMYNEASVVSAVVASLRGVFDLVVCVDDGSRDDSAQQARAAGATVLRHAVNLGQGAALQTGFDYVLAHTTATHVITFDSDGQHAVGDALAMLQRARSDAVDVVLGSRRLSARQQTLAPAPRLRRILLSLALRYSRWACGLELTDTHNGLRVLSRTALLTIRLRQRGMAHASELEAQVADRGLSWCEHPVTISYSEYSLAKGQSNLNAFNIVYDLAVARLHASS